MKPTQDTHPVRDEWRRRTYSHGKIFLLEVQQLERGGFEVVLSKDLDLHLIPARVEVRISRRKFMGEKNAF